MPRQFVLSLAPLLAAIGLCFATPAQADLPPGFDFGDDSGRWANDGECDDPRFEGEGMAAFLSLRNMMVDASDCRALYGSGMISVVEGVRGVTSGEGVDFGDDSGRWANDGECDDPRFEGVGMATILLDADIRKDASDCRKLYEAGAIRLRAPDASEMPHAAARNDGTPTPSWGTSDWQLQSVHGAWSVYCHETSETSCVSSSPASSDASLYMVVDVNDRTASTALLSTNEPFSSAQILVGGRVVPKEVVANDGSETEQARSSPISGIRHGVSRAVGQSYSEAGERRSSQQGAEVVVAAALQDDGIRVRVNDSEASFSTFGFRDAGDAQLERQNSSITMSDIAARAMPLPSSEPPAATSPPSEARQAPAAPAPRARVNCTPAEIEQLIEPVTRRATEMMASGRTPDMLRSQQYVFTNILQIFEDAQSRCGGFSEEIAYAREQLAITRNQMRTLGIR